MKVREIKHGDVTVLELSGRMAEGRDTDALSERINRLADHGSRKIIFDLSKVYWIDSSGLGLLIRAYTRMQKVGGDLKLARVTRSVSSLLQMTKLTTVFAVYDTLEGAIEAFGT